MAGNAMEWHEDRAGSDAQNRQQYQPGDVVNGYLLNSENEWVLASPAQPPAAGFRNTYVWLAAICPPGVLLVAVSLGLRGAWWWAFGLAMLVSLLVFVYLDKEQLPSPIRQQLFPDRMGARAGFTSYLWRRRKLTGENQGPALLSWALLVATVVIALLVY